MSWLQRDANECFSKHLEVIKATYYQPKKVGIDVWVLEVFFASFLHIQLAMKSIAFGCHG
jgi:hypothetical protein